LEKPYQDLILISTWYLPWYTCCIQTLGSIYFYCFSRNKCSSRRQQETYSSWHLMNNIMVYIYIYIYINKGICNKNFHKLYLTFVYSEWYYYHTHTHTPLLRFQVFWLVLLVSVDPLCQIYNSPSLTVMLWYYPINKIIHYQYSISSIKHYCIIAVKLVITIK